jgi:hypothetical protein
MFDDKLLDRFNKKISKVTSGCWEWNACRFDDGYGRFVVNAKVVLAHRMSYQIHVGVIPDNLLVLHKCDNPPCVNPEHLFVGTHQDNTDDMIAKGRGYRGNEETRPHGESCYNSKFKDGDIVSIRLRAAEGAKTKDLAKLYDVQESAIRKIITRTAWKHID